MKALKSDLAKRILESGMSIPTINGAIFVFAGIQYKVMSYFKWKAKKNK